MGVGLPRDQPISLPVRLTGPQQMNMPKRMSFHASTASGLAGNGPDAAAQRASAMIATATNNVDLCMTCVLTADFLSRVDLCMACVLTVDFLSYFLDFISSLRRPAIALVRSGCSLARSRVSTRSLERS